LRIRNSARAAAAAAVMFTSVAVALVPGTPAHAAADRCAGSGDKPMYSCVWVSGEGRHVQTISGGVEIGLNRATRGYVQVLLDGKQIRVSGVRTVDNVGNYTWKTVKTHTWRMDTSYRHGTEICVRWWHQDWQENGDMEWYNAGTACAEVKR
jgi:hypothetical protein